LLSHNHAVPEKAPLIRIKRVYEKAEAADGSRFLVDRLWPRGMTKAALSMEGWVKDAAPSNELRHWYHHDLEQWTEFRKRYFIELREHEDALTPLLVAARRGTITLLFGSKHLEHNNATALKEFLEQQIVRTAARKESKGAGRKAQA